MEHGIAYNASQHYTTSWEWNELDRWPLEMSSTESPQASICASRCVQLSFDAGFLIVQFGVSIFHSVNTSNDNIESILLTCLTCKQLAQFAGSFHDHRGCESIWGDVNDSNSLEEQLSESATSAGRRGRLHFLTRQVRQSFLAKRWENQQLFFFQKSMFDVHTDHRSCNCSICSTGRMLSLWFALEHHPMQ